MHSYNSIRPARWFAAVVVLVAVGFVGCGEGEVLQAVYTVKEYDPARDAAADLAATIETAKSGNKRIVLQVGGEWCGWCHKLDRYIAEHPAVAESLHNDFVIMKVNMSDENNNEAFLSRYPDIPGYPHWYVLESDGTLLHSQGTAELEEGPSYSESALLEFLATWSGRAT